MPRRRTIRMRHASSRPEIPGVACSNIVGASSGLATPGTACSATVDASWEITTPGTTVDNKLRPAEVLLRDFVGRVEGSGWSAKNKD